MSNRIRHLIARDSFCQTNANIFGNNQSIIVIIQCARKIQTRGCELSVLTHKTDRLKPRPPEVEALAGLFITKIAEESCLASNLNKELHSYEMFSGSHAPAWGGTMGAPAFP